MPVLKLPNSRPLFFPLLFLIAVSGEVRAQGPAQPLDSALLVITSDPEGGVIYLNNSELGRNAPIRTYVPKGEHVIELILEGYEPLAQRFSVAAGQRASLNFVLKSFPPIPIVAESLGLERLPLTPELDEQLAKRLEKKWTDMAETFAIVPLGQGIMARLLLPEDQHSSANAMVITGVGLTVTSYVIGKVLGKRKLRAIRARNEQIPAANDIAKRHNLEVDQAVKEANRSAVHLWTELNQDRGTVAVKIE